MHVSSGFEPDIIRITFRDKYIFVGENDLHIALSDDTTRRFLQTSDENNNLEDEAEVVITLEKELPTQLQLGGYEQQVQEALSVTTQSA